MTARERAEAGPDSCEDRARALYDEIGVCITDYYSSCEDPGPDGAPVYPIIERHLREYAAERCAPLVYFLRIYEHAHTTGSSVPPHVVEQARAALAAHDSEAAR